MDGFEAGRWEQALEVELWGLELEELEPIRAPLLSSAALVPVGSVAAGLSRVALAFGFAAEAADALEEGCGAESGQAELQDRLWELGAFCVAARACLSALGCEQESLAAASAAGALVVDLRDAVRGGGLLECETEPGAALIAHIGGFVGPLAVAGTLICESAVEAREGERWWEGEAVRFEEGERLARGALDGLADHAIDGAVRMGRAPSGYSLS